jgi:hypothetical protein
VKRAKFVFLGVGVVSGIKAGYIFYWYIFFAVFVMGSTDGRVNGVELHIHATLKFFH